MSRSKALCEGLNQACGLQRLDQESILQCFISFFVFLKINITLYKLDFAVTTIERLLCSETTKRHLIGPLFDEQKAALNIWLLIVFLVYSSQVTDAHDSLKIALPLRSHQGPLGFLWSHITLSTPMWHPVQNQFMYFIIIFIQQEQTKQKKKTDGSKNKATTETLFEPLTLMVLGGVT